MADILVNKTELEPKAGKGYKLILLVCLAMHSTVIQWKGEMKLKMNNIFDSEKKAFFEIQVAAFLPRDSFVWTERYEGHN